MDYNTKRVDELRKIAKSRGLKRYSKLKKAELVKLLSESKSEVKTEVKPKQARKVRVAECKKPKSDKKPKQPTIKQIRERCKSLGLVYDAKLKDCRDSKRKGKAKKEKQTNKQPKVEDIDGVLREFPPNFDSLLDMYDAYLSSDHQHKLEFIDHNPYAWSLIKEFASKRGLPLPKPQKNVMIFGDKKVLFICHGRKQRRLNVNYDNPNIYFFDVDTEAGSDYPDLSSIKSNTFDVIIAVYCPLTEKVVFSPEIKRILKKNGEYMINNMFDIQTKVIQKNVEKYGFRFVRWELNTIDSVGNAKNLAVLVEG